MKIDPTTKWVICLIVVGFLGAALFYSPYLGLDGQIGLECPLCPHIFGPGDPHVKFLRCALVGGILNSITLLLLGGIVKAIIAAWRKFRTYWM